MQLCTTTPHQISAASCHAIKHATTNTCAVQPKQYAMKPCNTTTDAACYHADVTITRRTSEISGTSAGVSQHYSVTFFVHTHVFGHIKGVNTYSILKDEHGTLPTWYQPYKMQLNIMLTGYSCQSTSLIHNTHKVTSSHFCFRGN